MKTAVYSYSTDNLGDEVQSIATKRLLPRVDTLIERDRLILSPNEPIFLIANGWHLHSNDFPPPPQVTPFYIAFHAANNLALTPPILAHLKAHGPIGCRDMFTLQRLKAHGIPAYWSGCLTTTLEARGTGSRKDVLLVDVDPDLLDSIPEPIAKFATTLTQHSGSTITPLRHEARILKIIHDRKFPATSISDRLYRAFVAHRQSHFLPKTLVHDRFQRAEHLLSRYEMAKLVITSRLHCALPCVAMGTPVVFLHNNPQDPRMGAVDRYLKVYSGCGSHEIDWAPEAIQGKQLNLHKAFLREAVRTAVECQANPFQNYKASDLNEITSSLLG